MVLHNYNFLMRLSHSITIFVPIKIWIFYFLKYFLVVCFICVVVNNGEIIFYFMKPKLSFNANSYSSMALFSSRLLFHVVITGDIWSPFILVVTPLFTLTFQSTNYTLCPQVFRLRFLSLCLVPLSCYMPYLNRQIIHPSQSLISVFGQLLFFYHQEKACQNLLSGSNSPFGSNQEDIDW